MGRCWHRRPLILLYDSRIQPLHDSGECKCNCFPIQTRCCRRHLVIPLYGSGIQPPDTAYGHLSAMLIRWRQLLHRGMERCWHHFKCFHYTALRSNGRCLHTLHFQEFFGAMNAIKMLASTCQSTLQLQDPVTGQCLYPPDLIRSNCIRSSIRIASMARHFPSVETQSRTDADTRPPRKQLHSPNQYGSGFLEDADIGIY